MSDKFSKVYEKMNMDISGKVPKNVEKVSIYISVLHKRDIFQENLILQNSRFFFASILIFINQQLLWLKSIKSIKRTSPMSASAKRDCYALARNGFEFHFNNTIHINFSFVRDFIVLKIMHYVLCIMHFVQFYTSVPQKYKNYVDEEV